MNDSLGDRMKRYEDCYRTKLPRRVPKIIRIDGKAFHTYLKNAKKPYDKSVMDAMIEGAMELMREVGGMFRFAYIQSDECTVALNDYLTLEMSPWFDNNIQKMVSVASSLFTNGFNQQISGMAYPAAFDARVFVVPEDEIVNNLIWRQNDASRNSIQQYGRFYFSHKEMDGLSNAEVQEKMFKEKGFNWNDAPTWTKRGVVVHPKATDWDIPQFTADRDYLMNLYRPASVVYDTIP